MQLYFIYFKKYWQKKQMAEAEVAEAEAGWGWDGNFSYIKEPIVSGRHGKAWLILVEFY